MAEPGHAIETTAFDTELNNPVDPKGSAVDVIDPNANQTSTSGLVALPRTLRTYPRPVILFLAKSPQVCVPKGMPAFKDWFGDWAEPHHPRKDVDANGVSRSRYRAMGEDGQEVPPREGTSRQPRPTFSQATAMGNFRHQPLKLETGDRDRDGHGRLRDLSDRYDRDRERLRSTSGDVGGMTSPSTSGLRRDQGSNLASSNRQTSSSSLTAMNGRRDSRIIGDKDRPSDLPARPNGDSRRHERTLTMNGKETSETRNDKTDDWRKVGDRWDDQSDRDRDRPRRNGDRRSRSRGWDLYDGSRDRRSRSRDPDRRGGWDREPWQRVEGRRDRDRHTGGDEEGAIIPLRNTRRGDRDRDRDRDRGGEREGRRDRDRDGREDKEPAWMDDWDTQTGDKSKGLVLGGLGGEGELDKLQMWKKEMKDKEVASSRPTESPSTDHWSAATPGGGLNDIEKFKLQMKEAQSEKPTTPSGNHTPATSVPSVPPGLTLPVLNDPAIVTQAVTTMPSDPAILSAAPTASAPAPSYGLSSMTSVDAKPISLATLGLAADKPSELPTSQATPVEIPSSAQASSFAPYPYPSSSDQSTPDPSILLKAILKAEMLNTDLQVPTKQMSIASHSPTEPRPDTLSPFANGFASYDNHGPTLNGTMASQARPDVEVRANRGLSSATPSAAANATTNAPGRGSKFAKFFQTTAPKDDILPIASAPSSATTSSILPTPSSAAPRDGFPLSSMGMGSGMLGASPNPGGPISSGGTPFHVNGLSGTNNAYMSSGLPGLGPRMASPTQPLLSQMQQQQSMGAVPPRMGNNNVDPAALAGLFGAPIYDRNGPGPVNGAMESVLNALENSARNQQMGRSMGRIPQQQVSQPQKPLGQQFMNGNPSQYAQQLQQQQLSQMSLQQQHMAFSPPPSSDVSDGGRFAPDNLVPGLRPQRSRDQSAGGMSSVYSDDRALLEERELNRQLQQQNLFGSNGPTPQQLFEYRQQDLLRQQQQQLIAQGMQKQQQLAAAQASRNMMSMNQFRPGGPSPIGGQNPLMGPGHQRGLSGAMGGPLARTPTQDLGGLGIGGGMRSAQDPSMNPMRAAQELALAGLRGHDMGGPLPGQQSFSQQLGVGGGQNAIQQPMQRAMPPNHHLQQQQLAGGMMGPPAGRGSLDFEQHDLQAARLRQQAQIQQQLSLGGASGQQPLGGPVNQYQQLRMQQIQQQQQPGPNGGLPSHMLQNGSMAVLGAGQMGRQQQMQNRNMLGDFGAAGMNLNGPLSGPGAGLGGVLGAAGQHQQPMSQNAEQVLQFLRGGTTGPGLGM